MIRCEALSSDVKALIRFFACFLSYSGMGSGTARPDISVRVQDDANNKGGDDVGRRYPKAENASLQVSGVLGHRQILHNSR